MSRYCPIVDHNVIYQFCEDCEDRQCSKRNIVKQKGENVNEIRRPEHPVLKSGN